MTTLIAPGPVSATPLVNDYPSYLRAQPRDALVDPWYFYSRECTSFVAWRLNDDNHLPFSNSWGGVHWGNAYQWGAAARALGFAINNSPSVGSVAWWNGSNPSASTFGHVAWVAEVYSDGSILIEEYNYLSPGNYDQRHLYPGTYWWPSGFLHVGDLTMVNTAIPTITGTPTVGAPLTANPGSWKPGGIINFSYTWYAGAWPIAGATGRTFTPTPAQLGKLLTVKVTASMGGAKSKSVFAATGPAVLPGTLVPTGTPVVVGAPQVGVPLVAQGATWRPAPTVTYQWFKNGIAIPGATLGTYTPVPGDLGATITVSVTASATGYRVAAATIRGSANVLPGIFKVSKLPIITGGTPTVGTMLTASTGTWSPNATYTYQWFTDSLPIPGAVAPTYTPTPDVLGSRLSVQVTAASPGYTTKTISSTMSTNVIPGSFHATPLAALSTPAVGAPLSVSPGTITGTTTPTVRYQWNANGKAIPHATEATYTPTPGVLGKQLSVTVTASALGYNTLTRTTALSKAVQLGTLTIVSRPSFSGSPQYGTRYYYTPTVWSAAPGSVSLQWYANGKPMYAATGSSIVPFSYLVGDQLSVVERVTSPGYHDATITTQASGIVMGGTATLSAGPSISGKPLLGSVLTATTGSPFPANSARGVQWLRDGVPIAGATGWTYQATTADIGHHLSVEVTVAKSLWTSSQYTSRSTSMVQSVGRLTARLTRLSTGKVQVAATVSAPGVFSPTGWIEVWWGGHEHAKVAVVRGSVSFQLAIPTTVKSVTLIYLGDPRIPFIGQGGVAIH